MPSQLRRHALQRFLQTDEPAGGGTTTTTETEGDEAKPLGDAGKAALDAERKAAKASEARAKAAERELADLKAAKVKEEEAKQAEQGEWKTLAETREADLQSTKTTLESLKSEREKLAEYVKSDIATVTKTVKDAKDSPAAKVLMRYYPGDDADPLALLDWAQNAKASLPEIEQEMTAGKPGNGPNPKPAGAGQGKVESVLSKRQILS